MPSNSVNFTGRCPQIKTAYKVCHIVNENFPHISSTKFSPMFEKIKWQNADSYGKFINYNPMFPLSCSNASERKFFELLLCQTDLIRDMNRARERCSLAKTGLETALYNFSQLKFNRLGNCMEDARASETIMRMNGFDNVYTANLKRGSQYIDHMVCVFNKDGSKFDGNWNKNTIILDAWSGICDFAGNMFKKYENMFKDYFYISDSGKFGFHNVKSLKLSDSDLNTLKQKYPELLFRR